MQLRNFGYLLKEVSRRYVLRFEQWAQQIPLTLPPCIVLAFLENHQGIGQSKLDERATSKRAWNSWRKQKELHSLLLSSSQMRKLIEALGGAIPAADDQLIDTLINLLKGAD